MPAHRVLIATAAALLAAAPAAQAAPWKRLTASNGANSDQVALARTADGVLHVAWHHPTGALTADLLHTAISPSGRIRATSPIATGWTGFQNAGLVATEGGIRVFFGGQRSTETSDPDVGLITSFSADGGRSWALTPGSIVPPGGQAYGYPVSAAAPDGGTTLQTWAGTLGTWVHAGLTPATPLNEYQAPLGHYGYDPGIAAAGDSAVVAWYSNAKGRLGVYAQPVDGDGAAAGPLRHMPGTGDMNVGMIGRTPIAARPGGGFYVAYATGYPSLDRVRVWRVGSRRAGTIARTGRAHDATATIAAAGDGRLWVVWKDSRGSRPRVLARRSDRSARRFGAVVDAGAPRRAASLYRLDASAAPDGGLDVLGAFSRGAESTVATFHRRIRAGLTLTASPSKLRRGRDNKVLFRVSDAGEPVKGAHVRAGGSSGRTDRRGRVVLHVKGSRRSVRARASEPGYATATKRLRVRR